MFVLGRFCNTAPLLINLGKLCQAILTILRKDYNRVELLLPCHLRLIASLLTHAFLTEVHTARITFTRTNPKGLIDTDQSSTCNVMDCVISLSPPFFEQDIHTLSNLLPTFKALKISKVELCMFLQSQILETYLCPWLFF